MRRNSNFNYIILSLLVVFMLQGCDIYSFNKFADTVNEKTSNFIESVINYNYSEFFYKLKMAYKTTKRERYPEIQFIDIATQRDGQLYAYNGVIEECKLLPCNIKESIINRNTIFPENTMAKLVIEIPVVSAQAFLDAISKYGKIVKNKNQKDMFISKDLDYYNNEIQSLQLIKDNIEANLSKKDVFNPKQVEELEEELSSINNKLLYLTSDVKYLNDVQLNKLIKININKEFNSTSNKVKTKLQNFIYFLSDYLHIIILIIAFVIIYKTIKLLKNGIVLLFKSIKNRKKVVSQVSVSSEPHLPKF